MSFPEVSSHNVKIGSSITLSGKFSNVGKLGPYILCDGIMFYLLPAKATTGRNYDQMHGKEVTVTGELHFEAYYNFVGWDKAWGTRPKDHFYFNAETVRIDLK